MVHLVFTFEIRFSVYRARKMSLESQIGQDKLFIATQMQS